MKYLLWNCAQIMNSAGLTDDQSTVVRMAWCCQQQVITSTKVDPDLYCHTWYRVIKPQWVNTSNSYFISGIWEYMSSITLQNNNLKVKVSFYNETRLCVLPYKIPSRKFMLYWWWAIWPISLKQWSFPCHFGRPMKVSVYQFPNLSSNSA